MAYAFSTPFLINKSYPFIIQLGKAGAHITQCQALYKDTGNGGVLKLAQSNGTLLQATVCGLSLNEAQPGQPIYYAEAGVPNWDTGDQFTALYLSDAPGVIDTVPGSGFWVLVGFVGAATNTNDRLSAIAIVNGAVQI